MRNGTTQKQFARLREFKKQGGRCFWCDCLCILPEQLPFPLENNTGLFPPWLATLEHLYDKHHPERANPQNHHTGRRVMACRECNQARGVRTHKAFMRQLRQRMILDDPADFTHTAPPTANAIPSMT